jgi:hypothetical protein
VRLQVTIEVNDNFFKICNADDGFTKALPLSEIGNLLSPQKASSISSINLAKKINSSPPKNNFVSSG